MLSQRLAAGGRVRGLVLAEWAGRLLRQGQEAQARRLAAAAGAGLTAAEQARLRARAGDPERLGALVPLSGRWQAIGYHILQGMALAAGLVGRAHGPRVRIEVRDSEAPLGPTLADLDARGVVAVVGLPRSRRARQAAREISSRHLPALLAADGSSIPALGPTLFRAVHPPTARARALAAFAASRGLRRLAVLHLQGSYGRRTAAAFSAEARRRGLQVVSTLAYPRGDKALYARFRPLSRLRLDAVFVADSARHLEVVAPQLALAGLRATPAPGRLRPAPATGHLRPAPATGRLRPAPATGRLRPAPATGRLRAAPATGPSRGGVVLLSTAEGLSDRLRRNAGAAVQGAVLAPGYYPDPSDPILGGFARAYQQAYGEPPDRYAAAGYLAVLRVRSLLAIGRAAGRVSLTRALAAARPAPGSSTTTTTTTTSSSSSSSSSASSTSIGAAASAPAAPASAPAAAAPLRHDRSGERVDPPLLYEVRTAGIFRILANSSGTTGATRLQSSSGARCSPDSRGLPEPACEGGAARVGLPNPHSTMVAGSP